MKLKTAQIPPFLSSPDKTCRVFLFYGPDAGLVKERADSMTKRFSPDVNDPFRVSSLSSSSIGEGGLHDEMAALSFTGGTRVVRCSRAEDEIAGAVGDLLKNMPTNDSVLILEAGDLSAKSKLRLVCENGDSLVYAVPCYVEDNAQRQRVIAEILKSRGLSAPPEILRSLAEACPPDRIAMRSEIEKLALYAQGNKSVSMEDVRAILQESGAAEMDDLMNAVGLGDAKKTCSLLDFLFAEQIPAVAILRAAQRHFLRLQLARSHFDKGASAKEAVERLQPKVFWKSVEPLSRQVSRWNAENIEKFLSRLYAAEAAAKRTGTPDNALCSQLFLQAAGR